MVNLVRTAKAKLKDIPVIGPFALRIKRDFFQTPFSSGDYWEKRYRGGGNSGAGSYNRLARFKADVINNFVVAHDIKTVIEFGCGDGSQLALANYPKYVGIDVSETAIARCRELFKDDDSKKFLTNTETGSWQKAELALSLDVIYHLVEDCVFEMYMSDLFDSAGRFVIVYASDVDREAAAHHVRHRNFSAWVLKNRPNWALEAKIDNIYPFNPADPENTSFSDFFVFKRLS